MSWPSGARLGSYEIVAPLGAGGMGEVYRARDTKLDREVAIKILPPAFQSDPDRLARFEREARALAALNHPNIGTIYGVEEQPGVHALVLELVEGETLAQKLGHATNQKAQVAALPLDEALAIARQIIDALDAAHERGIIHRDLKPANIKITLAGTVKVLDFGLAKAMSDEGGLSDVSHSPTMTATEAGMIMGTAAYMSPEQAKGKAVDKCVDTWAFGCVLYEMLTGRRAFEGETVSEILAEVLKSEPDWSRLPSGTPLAIRRLLRHCLQKDRSARLRDIADARIDIDGAHTGSHDLPLQLSRSSGRERLAWSSIVTLLVLGLALLAARALRPAPTIAELRLDVATPSTTDPQPMAISPDGQRLAFVATSEGRPHLWVRPLNAASARPLAGTEEPGEPFWSPDGRSLAFFANGQLKRIDIDTGAVQTVADARGGIYGGAWNRNGVIVFVPTGLSPVFRVPAAGGEPVAVTRLEPSQTAHAYPRFLPDGHHFLYAVSGSAQVRGIYMGDVDGSPGRRLLDADAQADYTAGHILFVRQRTLLAQAFDPARLVLTGEPVPVAEGVAGRTLSAAEGGPIVYRASPTTTPQRQFGWFDRSGKETKLGDPDDTTPFGLWMSPDGRRVLLSRQPGGNRDIWSLDTTRVVLSRLTTNPRAENYSVASPDGSRIVFSSNRKAVYDLYVKRAADIGNEELLLMSDQNKNPVDWSPDGRFILFEDLDPKTGFDLWALPMDGDKKPFPVVQTGFDDRDGQFSPDGHWVAYQSDQSGRAEIYLRPFPGPGDPAQVSTAGGAQVRWRPDGKELFYIALDGRLMAVPTRFVAGGTADLGAPVPLFATRVGAVVQGFRQQYAVVEDGQRFLMNTLVEEAPAPITIILNWKPSP